jgi:CheY-like chemotaxis protein
MYSSGAVMGGVAVRGAGRPPAVLVIEDDVVLRRLLVDVLRDEAHGEVIAVDFDEAVGPRRFDLVLTDLPARRYVATQARDWVRSLRERFPGTPIVLCTAHQRAGTEPDRLGADALLPKPFDIAHLLRLLELLTGADPVVAVQGALEPAAAAPHP